MNEGTSNDASMNEERVSRINEAKELFDKLYDFFHRYFSPSGSIYFQHTLAHKNIYEKIYPMTGMSCSSGRPTCQVRGDSAKG